MTDQTRVISIMNAILHGGSAPVYPSGLVLRLMSALGGGNTASNTELTAGNSPGYTAPSATTVTFGANSAGTSASTNAPTWTATGTWTAGVAGCEIWDTAGTPLRWFQGALTTAITASAVTSGDTITFAIGSITANASAW